MSTDTPTPPETPDIPEKGWTNPFGEGTPLAELFEEVVQENRDLIIILDDYWGRRGTGKTVASLQLANGMDQTAEGVTWSKTSLEPEEIRNAYANEPQRSGLVLDEAEFGASNRQAMSKTNQALREIMSMGRVEEKYVIVNAPIKSFIDTDIQKLADVWISMVRKGQALVHFYEWEPYSKNLLTRRKQWIEFDDIPKDEPLRNVYNKLTREKRKRIAGEEGQGFIPADKHQEQLTKAKEQARRDMRNELIRDIHARLNGIDDDDMTRIKRANGVSQSMIGEAVGLSQQQIGNILQGDM